MHRRGIFLNVSKFTDHHPPNDPNLQIINEMLLEGLQGELSGTAYAAGYYDGYNRIESKIEMMITDESAEAYTLGYLDGSGDKENV